jgi:hypothetical protein|tara:strand:+ start:2841 stop:7040 length:4200 start_codon:yes stop_codon:yes gene_type:complete
MPTLVEKLLQQGVETLGKKKAKKKEPIKQKKAVPVEPSAPETPSTSYFSKFIQDVEQQQTQNIADLEGLIKIGSPAFPDTELKPLSPAESKAGKEKFENQFKTPDSVAETLSLNKTPPFFQKAIDFNFLDKLTGGTPLKLQEGKEDVSALDVFLNQSAIGKAVYDSAKKVKGDTQKFIEEPTLGKGLGVIWGGMMTLLSPAAGLFEKAKGIPGVEPVLGGFEDIHQKVIIPTVDYALQPLPGESEFMKSIKQDFLKPAFSDILFMELLGVGIKGAKITAEGIRFKYGTESFTFKPSEAINAWEKSKAGEPPASLRDEAMVQYVEDASIQLKKTPSEITEVLKKMESLNKAEITAKIEKPYLKELKEKWKDATGTDIPQPLLDAASVSPTAKTHIQRLVDSAVSIFKEGKLIGLEGAPGGLPQTSLATPSAKQFETFSEKATDVEFTGLDDMKLIQDRLTGDVLGVQNRVGDKQLFPRPTPLEVKPDRGVAAAEVELERIETKKTEIEVFRDTVQGFTEQDLKDFDTIRGKMEGRALASGDVVALKGSEVGELATKVLEKVAEVVDPAMTDEAALDFVMKLPSRPEIAALERQIKTSGGIKGETVAQEIQGKFTDKFEHTAQELLKVKLGAEARGAKKGFIVGKKLLSDMHKELNSLTRKVLPAKDRRPFFTRIVNAKTAEAVSKIRGEITAKAAKIKEAKRKESLMKQIRKRVIALKKEKKLSDSNFSKLKEINGIRGLKGASEFQLEGLISDLKELKEFDIIVSKKQRAALEKLNVLPEDLLRKKVLTREQLKAKGIVGEKDIMHNMFIPPAYGKSAQPIVEVLRSSLAEASIATRADTNTFIEEYRKLVKASRKSRKMFQLVSQDNQVISKLEGDTSVELTPEQEALYQFTKDFYATVADFMTKEGRIRRNYFTHIKRGFLESWKEEGFVEAFKNAFRKSEDFRMDASIWENLEEIVANQKFNPFSLPRSKEGIPYTKDLSKAMEAYARIYFMKKNMDPMMPATNAIKSLVNLPRSNDFIKQYGQALSGRPMDLKQPKVMKKIINGFIGYTYWRFLALNWKAGLVNTVAGKMEAIIDQEIPNFLLGEARFFRKKGQDILKKQQVMDDDVIETSINMFEGTADKVKAAFFFNMRGGGRLPWGENWIQGAFYLGQLTKEEFKTGEITPERNREILDEIGNIQGPYRFFQKPVVARTALGRAFTQMKLWMFGKIGSRVKRYKATFGPEMLKSAWGEKKMNKAQRSTLKEMVMLGALIYLMLDDEGEDSKVKEVTETLLQDMFSFVDLTSWSWTIRTGAPSFGTLADVLDFFTAVGTGSVYKRDSKYGKEGDLKAIPKGIDLLPARKPVKALFEKYIKSRGEGEFDDVLSILEGDEFEDILGDEDFNEIFDLIDEDFKDIL